MIILLLLRNNYPTKIQKCKNATIVYSRLLKFNHVIATSLRTMGDKARLAAGQFFSCVWQCRTLSVFALFYLIYFTICVSLDTY